MVNYFTYDQIYDALIGKPKYQKYQENLKKVIYMTMMALSKYSFRESLVIILALTGLEGVYAFQELLV